MNKTNKRKWYQFIPPAAVCLLAVLCCLLLYRYDNKYTYPGPQAMNGILLLDGETLAEHPVFYLVDGWEYYSGRLLSPEDFRGNPPIPDEYIFIGRYGGLEPGNASRSPHGSASYRLIIALPEETGTYTLELPEIFSACRVYVNGREVAAIGDPDPGAYYPETGNRAVSFEAGGQAEILIAASDYSHLYSGMVYSPAFGRPDAVSGLLNSRFAFRTTLCAAAVTVGLLALLIGLLGRKSRTAVLFSLLCLLFVGYAGYPVWKTLGSGFYPLYVVENLSFCAMLLVVMMLQRKTAPPDERHHDWGRHFILFGCFMCAASVILHILLPSGILWVLRIYSWLISAYEWVTAAFITVTALHAMWKNRCEERPLLYGILVFDCALIMDRLLPLYEPSVTGWFIELASFVLVLAIGAVTGKEVAGQYRMNTVLEERARHAEQFGRIRETYYAALKEQMEETRTAHHDMRHHFIAIGGFVKNRSYAELEEYIAAYGKTFESDRMARYCDNETVNVLAHYYSHFAAANGIRLDMRLDVKRYVPVSAADLSSILSNLLENAVEACLRMPDGERFIALSVGQKAYALAIHMENSANETPGDPMWASSKSGNRRGYGLISVRAAAAKYAGEADFGYDRDNKLFKSTVMLRLDHTLEIGQ